MGYVDANGVWFYDENDIISPIHTWANLAQSRLSEQISGWDTSSPRWRNLTKGVTQTIQNSSATWTKVIDWTPSLNDPGNEGENTVPYNATTDSLVIPVRGVYLVNASIGFVPNPNGVGAREIALFVNGTQYQTEYMVAAAGRNPPAFLQTPPAILMLDEGDVLDVRVRQSSGSNLNLYVALGGRGSNSFSIAKIAGL